MPVARISPNGFYMGILALYFLLNWLFNIRNKLIELEVLVQKQNEHVETKGKLSQRNDSIKIRRRRNVEIVQPRKKKIEKLSETTVDESAETKQVMFLHAKLVKF